MFVHILFSLSKAIPIIFERVITHYQTLQTWAGMMQRVTITSTHYYTRYHMRYCTFSPSLAWLGYNAICYHNFNMLPRALPYIFSKFSMVWGLFAMRGNVYPLQGLVMCSNTFNMTKMEVTEGYANVSYIARWPIHVCRVWKAAM